MFGVDFYITYSSQIIIIFLFLCLFLPLFVGLLALRSSLNISKDLLSYLPILSIFISFLSSIILFLYTTLTNQIFLFEGPLWFSIGQFIVKWSFLVDSLSSIMLVIITFISFLVYLYSYEYMSHDYNKQKFMGYLCIFSFFMMILVTSANLPQMFLGWEGVGLFSFLLITYWNTRIAANKAAIKAIIVNKFGDFFFMMGICALAFCFGTLDLLTILQITSISTQNYLNSLIDPIVIFGYNNITLDFCCFMFFLAALAKSAQIPFHTWLPDAMEGPSPVSALLHAATMVTAGVFLICRLSPLFQLSPFTLCCCTLIGALTALFASTSGLFQNDIKRIVALSTCSQIGYMFFICGLSGYNIAIFHLFTHACFKAGLFLCCGSIIHALADEQDIRRMGSFSYILPFSATCMIICSLSLAGFPFLAGYYSKDAILELAFYHNNKFAFFVFIIGTISAFFTAMYSVKLLYLVFITRPNVTRNTLFQMHDAPLIMAIPIAILTFFSIFVGFFFRDLFIGPGTDFWSILIPLISNVDNPNFSEYLSVNIKLIPTIAAFFGALLSIPLLNLFNKFNFTSLGRNIYVVLNYKWYFDHIYSYFFVYSTLYLGQNVSLNIIDKGILEKFGPSGITKIISYFSIKFSNLQSGYIQHYLYFYLLGFFFIIFTISLYFLNIDLYNYFDLNNLIVILTVYLFNLNTKSN